MCSMVEISSSNILCTRLLMLSTMLTIRGSLPRITQDMLPITHLSVGEELIQNDHRVLEQAKEVVQEDQEVQEGLQDQVQERARLVPHL